MRLSWGLRGGLAAPPPRHLGGDGAGVREGGSVSMSEESKEGQRR